MGNLLDYSWAKGNAIGNGRNHDQPQNTAEYIFHQRDQLHGSSHMATCYMALAISSYSRMEIQFSRSSAFSRETRNLDLYVITKNLPNSKSRQIMQMFKGYLKAKL